jgi:hypothetical protein
MSSYPPGIFPLLLFPISLILCKPFHLEAVQLHRFVRTDTAFLAADVNLVFDGFDAFEVRQEEAAAVTGFNDDAVLLRGELGLSFA